MRSVPFLAPGLAVDSSQMKADSGKTKIATTTTRAIVALAALLLVGLIVFRPQKEPDPVTAWREGITAQVGALARKDWSAATAAEGTESLGAPVRITIHHSGAGTFSAIDRGAVTSAIKAIQDTHIGANGWDDIGYHYIVDPFGCLWEGRHLDRIGAHAGSLELNRGNIGILLLGNFDLQEPPPAQLERLGDLLAVLQGIFTIADSEIYTHNRIRIMEGLTPTACPGQHIIEWLESRRKKR